MRRILLGASLAIASLVAGMHLMAQQPPARRTAANEAPATVDKARQADDQAIRVLANSYAKAYNAHDSKAIANLFTADAQIVDDAGDAVQGRAAIERVFAEIFGEFPQSQTTIAIQSIRFLSPSLAVEDGTATVALAPGEPPAPNRYTAIHVKQDNKWLTASAHDLPIDAASPEDHLKQLAWLIGEWVDESPDSLVVTTYRWDDNHNFILSDFSIQVSGRGVMNGSQRIGWDPLAKVIRSWIFDSEGGFAEGIYSRDGERWIVKMTGVTRDGLVASATNSMARISKDRFSWSSRDRMVGGEPTGDMNEVIAVRKPPQPK